MMTTTFPGALDDFTNPVTNTPLSSATPLKHSEQHANANDALEAVEAKLGIGASTPLAGRALLGGSVAGSIWDRLGRKNLIINGDMVVAQRRARNSAVVGVDVAYQACDRWKTLYSGAGASWNIFPFDVGAGAMGYGASQNLMLLQSLGNSGKVGVMYIFEGLDTIPLRGQAVSLQANIVTNGASINDIRMALLSWIGTVDTAGLDPIATWNADGTNPTLAANWSYINTPVNLGVIPGPVIKKLENQIVPVGCNNLALIIWCEDSINTSGQSWYFTDVQLELGAVCTSFERIPFVQQFMMCQRYYQTSYTHGVTPGTITPVGEVICHAGNALAGSTPGVIVPYGIVGTKFGIPTRTTPTISIMDPVNGAIGSITVGGTLHRTGVTAGNPSPTSAVGYLSLDGTSAQAITDRQQLEFHWTAGCEL